MSASLVRREPDQMLMSSDEMTRMFRTAEALALSNVWKDITQAEQAFAKMLIGRDLGMTPAQAMQGIHMVKGNIQMHYTMLGQFVRTREGYDYRAGWLKEGVDATTGEVATVAVFHSDEDPVDDRKVIGAFAEFTVEGERRGVSRYTLEDAKQAGLIKDGGAWKSVPRNMLLARALSNGVKWYVPEVLAGLPVYADGEIPIAASVTEPTGDGEAAGIELTPKVEKVIARATALGHRGLSNRAVVEVAVGGRAPAIVNDWVERANVALDEFAASKETTTEPEPEDAVVVDADEPNDEPIGDVEVTIEHDGKTTSFVVPDPDSDADPEGDEPDMASDMEASALPDVEPNDVAPVSHEGDTPAPAGADSPGARILRHRLDRLTAMLDDADERAKEELNAEINTIETQLKEMA